MGEEALFAYFCDVVLRGGIQAVLSRWAQPAVPASSCPVFDPGQCQCPERRAVELTLLAAVLVLVARSLLLFLAGVAVGRVSATAVPSASPTATQATPSARSRARSALTGGRGSISEFDDR